MNVTCILENDLATVRLDVRRGDGTLDQAAWREIQSNHDGGWQKVGLWALKFKGLACMPGAQLKWRFSTCPYVARFSVRVEKIQVLSKACEGADQRETSQRIIQQPAVPLAVSQPNDVGHGSGMFSFKWDNVGVLLNAEPLYLFFKGEEYPLNRKWENLLEQICIAVEKIWPGKLKKLVTDGRIKNMGLHHFEMQKGHYVPEAGIWYESSGGAKDFVKQARNLFRMFGVDFDGINISYESDPSEMLTTVPIMSVTVPDDEQQQKEVKENTLNNTDIDIEAVSPDVLVRSVILEIIKEGRDNGEIWDSFQSRPWCYRELGVTNSILRILKIFEKAEVYVGEYSILEPDYNYMVLKNPNGLRNSDFLDWVQSMGVDIECLCSKLHIKRRADSRGPLEKIYTKTSARQITVRTGSPSQYESQISELLEKEFANGVRPGSIIDQNKIRKLYRQYFNKDLPTSFAFGTVLPKIGIIHDGKVFPRPSLKGGGWRTLVERLVGQGHSVFQFSRFMERHAAELMQIGIVSSEMLCETMTHESQDTYEISGELFGPKGQEPLDKRFASLIVPQEGSIIDMVAVSRRIPYVDVAFIRNFCKGLDNLIRINQDTYAIVSRIEFDDAEIFRGRSQCESAIEAEGFFSLSQLHLDDSAVMNDRGLADSALRRAFFQRFLSERFDIHGQIVCEKGASIDGQIPLHAFLREHSDVSLEQLETVAKEYNIALWLALKTAHEEMVRVDRERFVAPALITFDVPLIDESISGVCEGCIMPFGAFANLSDFPAVPGFAWNEYLLEAFLRRASMEFRLVSPSAPARDVSGAVVPRFNREWSAEDAFATIALRCGVAAEAEEVGDFLVATQCVLRRSAKTVGAVVSRMKELEKR